MDKLTGVVWPGGKAYLFRRAEYVRLDIGATQVDAGYPKDITQSWRGVFESDLDAVAVWPNGKAYFFKGDQYVRYDVAADQADDGYPRSIAESWPGVFESDLDAVIVAEDGKAYIVKDNQYIRYDVASDRADAGFPQPVAGTWLGTGSAALGLSADGPNPVPPVGIGQSVRSAFLAFSKPLEGRVPWMYLDIKGLVTTGVGNLIEPRSEALKLPWVHKDDGSPASEGEISTEWDTVKANTALAQKGFKASEPITDLRLTDTSIDRLVLDRFDRNEKVLRLTFTDWDTWPADAQLGAHSIAWAGAGFPSKWPSFSAAAKAHDWRTAATESHIKDSDNPGVKPRNNANLVLFNNAAVVEATGRDKTQLYYPQQL